MILRMTRLQGRMTHLGVGIPTADEGLPGDQQRGVILVEVDGKDWLFPTGTYLQALTLFSAIVGAPTPHKTFYATLGRRSKPDDMGTWEVAE